jgi:hypothetical protein
LLPAFSLGLGPAADLWRRLLSGRDPLPGFGAYSPAGSVLFFNGHLWHGGTRNESRSPRRILQCQFVARDRAPPDAGPRDPPGRLSREARYILGARFALDLPRRKEPNP